MASAIRGLRLALGKAPETMAQLIGCSSAGYEKWEQGTVAPSAQWLLRMLQLCPDEETRNAFRIRAERRSRPRTETNEPAGQVGCQRRSRRPATPNAVRSRAVRSMCLTLARLRWFAQNLQGAADYFSRARK